MDMMQIQVRLGWIGMSLCHCRTFQEGVFEGPGMGGDRHE
jgi:hypothetical protein